MERYWVFAYHQYYPGGGMEDFHSCHNDVEEAIEKAKALSTEYDYVDIFDTVTRGYVEWM